MNEQKSEVAQLLHRTSLEYEAAERGLTGLSAESANPSLITAKLEQIQVYHEQLAGMCPDRCWGVFIRNSQHTNSNDYLPTSHTTVVVHWDLCSQKRQFASVQYLAFTTFPGACMYLQTTSRCAILRVSYLAGRSSAMTGISRVVFF